jgi:hypothetical protein
MKLFSNMPYNVPKPNDKFSQKPQKPQKPLEFLGNFRPQKPQKPGVANPAKTVIFLMLVFNNKTRRQIVT